MKFMLPGALVFLLSWISCTHPPAEDRRQAMRLKSWSATLGDDLSLESLEQGVGEIISRLGQLKEQSLTFGPQTISSRDYAVALELLLVQLKHNISKPELMIYLQNNFDVYEAYGDTRWGEVLLTGYYEAVIPGSSTKSDRFNQPLYRRPPEMVDIVVPEDDDRFASIRGMKGRLARDRVRGGTRVLPYFSRQQIDGQRVLEKKGLEICWTDPLDAFWMQIQGSGTIVFSDNTRMALATDDSNGLRYHSIGKFLKDFIPPEQLDLPHIESHLRTLGPLELVQILYKNPSYVFFKRREGPPVTSLGVSAIDGRTIATDGKFFPKGALAYLTFSKPIFDSEATPEANRWESTGRIVFDTDSGGAIKGTGRVDLYWGSGPVAKQAAGVMKHPAMLHYLVPKRSES